MCGSCICISNSSSMTMDGTCVEWKLFCETASGDEGALLMLNKHINMVQWSLLLKLAWCSCVLGILVPSFE